MWHTMYHLVQGVDALDEALDLVVANCSLDSCPTIAPSKEREGISQDNGVDTGRNELRFALCGGGCHALNSS